jgi:transcriptional regulator with XRE-family HTH domain
MTYESTRPAFTAKIKPGALKLLMDFHNISYREAARRTGVSVGTIGNIVTEARKYVNPSTAGKIAKGLGVETDSLFEIVETVNLSEQQNHK